MSMARTARRRRLQMASNNAHISGMGVSRYSRPDLKDIGAAIAAERVKARREQAARTKKAKR